MYCYLSICFCLLLKDTVDGAAKKRRFERFGAVPHSEVRNQNHSFIRIIYYCVIKEDEQQKKRTRADRFHVVNATPSIDEETKKKRIDRFGVVTPSTVRNNFKKIEILFWLLLK